MGITDFFGNEKDSQVLSLSCFFLIKGRGVVVCPVLAVLAVLWAWHPTHNTESTCLVSTPSREVNGVEIRNVKFIDIFELEHISYISQMHMGM